MIAPQHDAEGEFLSIPDRLVVAPQWGRFHGRPLEEGQRLRPGAVVASVTQGRDRRVVRTRDRCVLVRWLAYEGEWVAPGTPLARLRAEDSTA